MHVMLRRYRMSGSMDDLMRKVDKQFAAQLSSEGDTGAPVRVPPGIVSYQAVRTGDDSLLTITVFESAELLDRAQQAAADIRGSLAEFDVEELGTLTGSIDISRVGDSFLTPVRPS